MPEFKNTRKKKVTKKTKKKSHQNPKEFLKEIRRPLRKVSQSIFKTTNLKIDEKMPPPLIKESKKISKTEFEKITRKITTLVSSFKGKSSEGINPFWNDEKTLLSEKIWKPSPDLPENVRVGPECENHTWFTIKEKTEKVPFDPDIITIKEGLPFKHPGGVKACTVGYKTLKFRIFPTEEEKKMYKKIFDYFRWYYNMAVQLFSDNYESFFDQEKEDIQYRFEPNFIRDNLIGKYKYREEDGDGIYSFDPKNKGVPKPSWMMDCHSRVPKGAFRKFTSSLNSVITNYKEGNLESKPSMGFMTKKNPTEYFMFEDDGYPKWIRNTKGRYWYTDVNGKRKILKLKEVSLNRGFEVIHDKITDKYFLHVPVRSDWFPVDDRKNDKQVFLKEKGSRSITLDPGVRKFMVGYDPAGKSIIFGEGANKRLAELLFDIDAIEEKRNVKRKEIVHSLWKKVKNLVAELHWKVIDYLIINYDVILLPEFKISQMVKNKNLPKITKRLLYMFSYHSFKTKLAYKCFLHGKKLVIVDESYTSKTCGNCGKINDLGGKEIYVCKFCGNKSDRDVMASRNIFLKSVDLNEV